MGDLHYSSLAIELLGEDFPGETPQGAAKLVERVRHAVNVQGDDKSVRFIDKGRGCYSARGGKITAQRKQALVDNNLEAYYGNDASDGNDASELPGNLQEVFPHETTVAWIRKLEKTVRPRRPWQETPAQFRKRMRDICQIINGRYNVESLCRSLPKRLQALVDAEGDRISTSGL